MSDKKTDNPINLPDPLELVGPMSYSDVVGHLQDVDISAEQFIVYQSTMLNPAKAEMEAAQRALKEAEDKLHYLHVHIRHAMRHAKYSYPITIKNENSLLVLRSEEDVEIIKIDFDAETDF